MKLKIVAMSNRDVFVGTDEDGEYVVLSLDDTRDISLGDNLSHKDWETTGRETVKNLTKREDVEVCIEDWGCSKARAFALLEKLNSPTTIHTL